jgi:hypothetical protein
MISRTSFESFDGRAEIVDEFSLSSPDLRVYVADGIKRCLGDRFFREALPTYFDDGPARLPILLRRLEALTAKV